MTDIVRSVGGLARAARRSTPSRDAPGPGADGDDDPAARTAPSTRAAMHTAAAERLAENGRYEQAYRHLREAVRLLHGGGPGESASGPRTASTPPSFSDELDRLRREHAEAHEQSRRDSLTDTYNRRYLDEQLADLLTTDTGRQVCLALADIDHFKLVNDTHGHPFGDRVLQRLVEELNRALPADAFCARYGGEEFALVLPGLTLADGVAACEIARDRVASHDWSALHPDLRMTISIGVAHTPTGTGVEALVAESDLLLYTAKQAGRNAVAYRASGGRVVLAGPASGRRSIPQPDVAGYRPEPPAPAPHS